MARRRKRQQLSLELPLLPCRRRIFSPIPDIKTLVLPKRNAKDLHEVPTGIRRGLRFVFAGDMAEVLKAALSETALVHPAP